MITEKEIIEILIKAFNLHTFKTSAVFKQDLPMVARRIISKLPKLDDWVEIEYGLIKLYLSGGSGFKINQVRKVSNDEYLIKIKYGDNKCKY